MALISESGANPFGLTVDAVMEEYRRWRNKSWRYDGSDKYPWSQPVLYHICLEMRSKGIERQMTEGELKRLAERQLAKWAKPVSYTHLDVYKRQSPVCGSKNIAPIEIIGASGFFPMVSRSIIRWYHTLLVDVIT